MNSNAEFESGRARILRRWQRRQRFDGHLVTLLVFLSLLPVAGFISSPDRISAGVMLVFLLALGWAGARLMIAAAKVAEIRRMDPAPSESAFSGEWDLPETLLPPGPTSSDSEPEPAGLTSAWKTDPRFLN